MHRHGGRVVVITGKYEPNARLHLEHLGLAGRRGRRLAVGPAEGRGAARARRQRVRRRPRRGHGRRPRRGSDRRSACRPGRSRPTSCGRPAPTSSSRTCATSRRGSTSTCCDVRLAALEARLRELGSVLVAFSGGADSAFLLAAAVRALGADRRGRGDGGQRQPARHRARRRRALRGRPRRTPPDAGDRRDRAARATGPTPATGATSARPSCSTSWRRSPASTAWPRSRPAPTPTTPWPGSGPASGRPPSAHAVTPLLDAGLTKAQVRAASRAWGLPTWDKPAAACLSSRVAFGIEITPARLARVERAEAGVRAALAAAGIEVDERPGARPRRDGPAGGRPGAGRGRRGLAARWPTPCARRASPTSRSTRAGSGPAR